MVKSADFWSCWCVNVTYATAKLICTSLSMWTICWALVQVGIFGWQISVTMQPDFDAGPVQFKTALTVIHIINIILSVFLLITGAALVYCLWADSKMADIPWALSYGLSILAVFVWCLIWWSYGIVHYWLMLTIVEFLFSIFNSCCLSYAVVLHQRYIAV